MSHYRYQRRILHLEGKWDASERVNELVSKACPRADVVRTASGAEALAIIRSEPLDLVIVDPRATESNGFKICKYVAETKPYIPVFVYAKRALRNDRKLAKAAGAAAFFQADDHDELIEAMTSVLE
jgi:CheY-like chemotaxis protein